MPAVTTRWPTLIRSPRGMSVMSRSFGLPGDPVSTIPGTPNSAVRADTPLVRSVMRVTCAASPVTVVTRPTRPSPLTTGSSTSTPSELPRLMLTVEYQSVGERTTTRAVTGPMSLRPASALSRASAWSWRPWRAAERMAITSARSASRSRLRSLFSFLASTVSPIQPKKSRTGLSARLPTLSTGESTSRKPRWIACSPPPAPSPK